MVNPTTGDDFLLCYRYGLLADVVWHEARGESFEGKVAVAEVVLNRTKDARWSNDIEGVVLQKWQFSCYNENDPNSSKRPKPAERPGWSAFKECCEAAAAAMGGTDHSGGANHYVNLNVARPVWFDEKKVTARIGAHTFLRL